MNPRLRIAMWCAPRTVSTALLRSFVQRRDTTGVDEPLYAWYLATTGKDHPLREEVLRAQSRDWRQVLHEVLLGPCPTPVQFVKHMAHHLVGDLDLEAFLVPGMVHAFLIRHPRELLPSLHRALGRVEAVDTAYEQQLRLFRRLREGGEAPPVVDSREILQDPEGMLRALCRRLGLDFDPAMLSWDPGRHPCYGVWARHWYAGVEASTGFQPWQPKTEPLPPDLEPLLAWAMPRYEELAAARLAPEGGRTP